MTDTPRALVDTDWRAMYVNLLHDWARVCERLGVEAETGGDVIEAINALAADAQRQAGEVERLREALLALVDAAETLHGSAIGERLGLHGTVCHRTPPECYVSEVLAAVAALDAEAPR